MYRKKEPQKVSIQNHKKYPYRIYNKQNRKPCNVCGVFSFNKSVYWLN